MGGELGHETQKETAEVQVVWTEEVLSDVESLRICIEKDRPHAARAPAQQIVDLVESLAERPGVGRPGRVPGTKELVVSGTTYIVPYRVHEGMVEVLRVLHGAMRWRKTFEQKRERSGSE